MFLTSKSLTCLGRQVLYMVASALEARYVGKTGQESRPLVRSGGASWLAPITTLMVAQTKQK